ncbi:hypothetical protein [Vreelandella alkaliphila]|uniref:hypothetical protein n=1 Tax=Vreelandella alkaliphila TaxID=272774 RepID=UPI003FD79280
MKPLSLHFTKSNANQKRCRALLLMIGLLVTNMMVAQADKPRIAQYVNEINTTFLQSNISVIEQQGNSNKASVIQSHSGSYQLGNLAHIHQLGNNNEASIHQSNNSNIGIILQAGNDHSADIVQTGNNFQAKIDQFGFNSDISLSQSGSGLRSISVEQQNLSGYARPITIDTR